MNQELDVIARNNRLAWKLNNLLAHVYHRCFLYVNVLVLRELCVVDLIRGVREVHLLVGEWQQTVASRL